VHEETTDAAPVALLEEFLRSRGVRPDGDALEAARAVDLVQAEPSIARVDDLADRVGLGVRALQRLFTSHVGVPPKWVIRRFRVQEAAERLANGGSMEWSRIAADLGYFDQAHFIRDFKAQIGRTPSAYASACKARASARS